MVEGKALPGSGGNEPGLVRLERTTKTVQVEGRTKTAQVEGRTKTVDVQTEMLALRTEKMRYW